MAALPTCSAATWSMVMFLSGKPLGLILADSGEESLHTVVPAGHAIVEVGEDGEVIAVGVDGLQALGWS